MYIYLPIAEISVNIIYIFAVGFMSGCISALFGISGSFIGVPILVAYGIDSASSVSSFINIMFVMSFIKFKENIKEKNINFNVIKNSFFGSIIGVLTGTMIFKILNKNGYTDIAVSFIYIFFLGSIATFMIFESLVLNNKKKQKKIQIKNNSNKEISFFQKIDIFPNKIKVSDEINISFLFMNIFTFFAGILVSMAGVASGLIMIPVMIYIYKMNTRNAMETSNLNGGIIVFFSNILQIITVQKTDFILSNILLIGSITGLILSKKISDKLSPTFLRAGLSILMLSIVMKMIFYITLTPNNIYSIFAIN